MNSKGSTVDEGVEPGYSIQEIAQLPVIIGSNEAGRLLRLSPRSVVRYAQKEEIPSIKIGKRYRFLRDAILEIAGLDYERVLEDAAALERKREEIAQAVKEGRKDETRSSELRDLLLDMAEQLV